MSDTITSDLVLFWHRRDLRLSDNQGLHAAFERSEKVIGVFCLDPHLLNADDVAPARVSYMLGCLRELATSYRTLGSRLLVVQGDPIATLPTLAIAVGASAVYWNRDVEPYARQRDREVAAELRDRQISVEAGWDQLMHIPGAIRTSTIDSKPYTVFTPFRKNWSRQPQTDPVPSPTRAIDLTPAELQSAQQAGTIEIPSDGALGIEWNGGFPIAPGEAAAKAKLKQFVADAIFRYHTDRELPSVVGTSGLSAALKFGAIGIREVWQATHQAAKGCRNDVAASDGVRTWQDELIWREFYQTVLYFFPALADGPYREMWQDFPWENDRRKFQAWCDGRTGYPIVDAAMRQLKETGWMHNRCRMIVASFLTKDLCIDWRWGERYFMQHLVDGDLAANNGGWQWSASSGMDPKPLRIFNPTTQGKKFDPDATYIRKWLPEIRTLETKRIHGGGLTPLEAQSYGYVTPIVDHTVQQKRFKEIYKQQKEKYS
ncbi:MAG: deoxyribodipyrimidine photolyase [Oscillatoriales cyanobacterium]|nr:MAG: deoxyribodipyrimidine photolyase [Oscillatoriales cyanobacterium]